MSTLIDVRDKLGAGGYATNDLRQNVGHSIHHSVSGGQFFAALAQTEADEVNHLRMIHVYHISKDYGAFAYHTAAFPSGRSYLCGNWNSRRAGVASRNHELVHSVAIGTFTDALASEVVLGGLALAVRTFRGVVGREVPVRGHRDWAVAGWGTSCPGLIGGQLEEIVRLAGTEGDEMTDAERATMDQAHGWAAAAYHKTAWLFGELEGMAEPGVVELVRRAGIGGVDAEVIKREVRAWLSRP